MKFDRKSVPGIIATGLMIIITTFWSYWSFAEMYHEGWWGPFYIRLAYLIPGGICLLMTLIGIKWPKVGGWLIIIIGGAFTVFFLDISIIDGKLSFDRDIFGFLISAPFVLIGCMFIFEGKNQAKRLASGWVPSSKWWKRNIRFILSISPVIIALVGSSIYSLPIVLTRIDDGYRGASLIEGNDVTLLWAPEGPGWNWKQEFGGYPSWNSIALYGVSPIGFGEKTGYTRADGNFASGEIMAQFNLCTFLNDDGNSLMTEAQYIWRMPSVDEYLRSFSRHNVNSGCFWNGDTGSQMKCEILPDKETPLWAPDIEPIYYWAVEEFNDREAYFVSYNGWVNTTYKAGGNPRHSYRCVRDVY